MNFFLRRHDSVLMVYLLGLGILALAVRDLLGLTFITTGLTGLVYFGTSRSGRRYSKRAFFLSLFVFLVNPLFNHRGSTLLFIVQGYRFTLESLQMGLSRAMSLYALLLIFQLWYHWLSQLALLRQTERFLPQLVLVLSLSLAFIPRLERQYEEVRLAQLSLGRGDGQGLARLKALGKRLTTLLAWALEDGMHIAHTLRLRGYQPGNVRTRAWTVPFLPMDRWLLIFLGGTTVVGFFLWLYLPPVEFYPVYSGWFGGVIPLPVWFFMIAMLIFGSLPLWFSWVYRRRLPTGIVGERGGGLDRSE